MIDANQQLLSSRRGARNAPIGHGTGRTSAKPMHPNPNGRIFRHLGTLLAVSLSAVFVYLAFREVAWREMTMALRGADYRWVALGAMIGLGGFVVRAFGWKFLLRPLGRLSGVRLFTPVAIGYMGNNLLPARVGEFARAYVFGKRERLSKSGALGTIVVERIFDGLALLLILVLISSSFPSTPWVTNGGIFVAVAFVGLALGLVVVSLNVDLGLRLIDRIIGPVLPIMALRTKFWLRDFVNAIDLKDNFGSAMVAFGFTLLRWTFEAGMYWLVLCAMGLEQTVPLAGTLLVMVAVNIACMVPQAPGFVGSVQFATIQALAVFHVDRETAAAYSLLVHAAFFFPITAAGIVCLLRNHFTMDELRHSREALAPSSDPGDGGQP